MKRKTILKAGLGLMCLSALSGLTACSTKTDNSNLNTHLYQEAVYTYSSDMKTVTGTRTCTEKNCNDKITETVDVNKTVIKVATCTGTGTVVYTSNNFTKEGFSVQTKTESIPALGHNYIHHDKLDATCTENGYEAYDVCDRCQDSTYKKIDKLGHSYEYTYKWSSDNKTVNATRVCEYNSNEVISEVVNTTEITTKTATCTEDGEKIIYATFTNPDFKAQQKKITINALGHDEVTEKGKEATCTEEGYTDKVYCKRCNIIIQNKTTIPTTNHEYIRTGVVEATCEHEGYTGDLECKFCHLEGEKGTSIPKTDHKEVIDEEIIPNCLMPYGKTEGSHCEYCGEIIVESIIYELENPPHTIVYGESKEVTCTEDGYTAKQYCDVCGLVTVESEVIPATGHTDIHIEKGYPATCTENGHTDITRCYTCGKTVDEGEVISATGHTLYKIEEDVYSTVDEFGNKKTGHVGAVGCKNCGYQDSEGYDYVLDWKLFEREAQKPTSYDSSVANISTFEFGNFINIFVDIPFNKLYFKISVGTIGNPTISFGSVGLAMDSTKGTNETSFQEGENLKATITLKDGTIMSQTSSSYLLCFDGVNYEDIATIEFKALAFSNQTSKYSEITYKITL